MTATTTTTRVSSLIKPNTSPKAVHFIIVCYMHSTKVKLILFQQWYSMHHIHFNILPYINLMYVINSLYLRWNFPERVRENRMFVTGCPCYKLSGLQVSGLYVISNALYCASSARTRFWLYVRSSCEPLHIITHTAYTSYILLTQDKYPVPTLY